MGRLLLLALGLFGLGIAMAPSREAPPRAAPVAAASGAGAPAPQAAVAYHPGEPMLVPGQSTELRREADGHFYAEASLNGTPVRMLVDTGATAVALTLDDARRLGLAVDPARFGVVGTGASGAVRGAVVTLDDVGLGGRHVGPVRAVVLEQLDRSLLGQSFLGRLDEVRIEGETMTLR